MVTSMTEQPFTAPLESVRKRIQEETQRLLGDTIGISDDDWNRPSLLPGWSRAHVAAHVAANAKALAQLVRAAVRGAPVELYPDEQVRLAGIERGSSMTGLELQISLDTSAGQLERAFDEVEDWTIPVTLMGRELTLAHVPTARLVVVVVHHLDLDCGFGIDRLDPVTTRWLLQWTLTRYADEPDLPALRIESTSDLTGELGRGGDRRLVTGGDGALWGWLMGRLPSRDVEGADGLVLGLRS